MSAKRIYKKKALPKSTKATGRDYTYDKQYQKKRSIVKYQVELHRKRRELIRKGKIKKGDKRDISHSRSRKSGGSLKNGYRLETASKNRGRK